MTQISPVELRMLGAFMSRILRVTDEGQDVESAVLQLLAVSAKNAKVKAQLELAKALLAA